MLNENLDDASLYVLRVLRFRLTKDFFWGGGVKSAFTMLDMECRVGFAV